MSAEGKKKRGVSGQTNAKNIPFRYKGYPRGYTLSTNIGRTNHPRMAGARLLHAMEFAVLLPGFNPSDHLVRVTDVVIEHITQRHPDTKYARQWEMEAPF